MAHVTFFKKPRGAYRLKQLADKRKLKADEDQIMAEAKRRDGNKCRWPGCRLKGLHVDCAHLEHRKMGGNPSGEATQRHKLIALCIRHHDQFDGRTIPDVDIRPVNAANGTDGPCEYYVRTESGEWMHVATERMIGISSERSLR